MRKLILVFIIMILTFSSCGDNKKEEVKQDFEPLKEKTISNTKEQQIALGEKLFTDKTCVACHALDTKIIGPSIKEMVKVYDEKGGNLVKFFRGNSDAIVDTDPGQVAIMKANLEGFVKDMTAEELQAIAAYMRHTAK